MEKSLHKNAEWSVVPADAPRPSCRNSASLQPEFCILAAGVLHLSCQCSTAFLPEIYALFIRMLEYSCTMLSALPKMRLPNALTLSSPSISTRFSPLPDKHTAAPKKTPQRTKPSEESLQKPKKNKAAPLPSKARRAARPGQSLSILYCCPLKEDAPRVGTRRGASAFTAKERRRRVCRGLADAPRRVPTGKTCHATSYMNKDICFRKKRHFA